MTIEVDLEHQQGEFHLELAFTAPDGITALFGRSGTGKTTIVNLLAGLTRPLRGRIVVSGRTLVDTEAGMFTPAHRRRIGYVFQEGRLLPHLTVRQNLLYGRWLTPRRDRFGSLDQTIELLGIGPLLDRRPAKLSGGEKQRVAIGRALLASPRLLLLDEPLAALDASRKEEILPFIERLRDELKIPIVYVTHSIEEVARLADTLVLLGKGTAIATGPTAELLTRLDLLGETGGDEGLSILTTRVRTRLTPSGLTLLEHPAGEFRLPPLDLADGAMVRLRIQARDVGLARGSVDGVSIRNRLLVRVVDLADNAPGVVDVELDAGGEPMTARLTREAADELGLAPGAEVTALVKTVALEGYPVGRAGPGAGDRAMLLSS